MGYLEIMAIREITTDDLDGLEGARPITFSLEGRVYNVDLHPENIDRLRTALQPFIDVARQVKGPARPPVHQQRAERAAKREFDITQLRAWAERAEVELPRRGRIPFAIIDQFKAAGIDLPRGRNGSSNGKVH